MKSGTLLGIYREQVFSPGKIEDDAAVLDASIEEMSALGWKVEVLRGEVLTPAMARPAHVLSMAQSERVLDLLGEWTAQGTRVINSVQSIRNCYRKPLIRLLFEGGVHIPAGKIVPIEDAHHAVASLPGNRLWLKRGDVHAIQAGDVASVQSPEDLAEAMDHFRSHGVKDLLIQQHVEGPVVKFYGVGRGEFFRAYLAATGEDITSRAEQLHHQAQHAAWVVGLEIYGGDAVLSGENGPVLIDLNDWPSFSRCFRQAAKSIAAHVTRI